MLAKKDLTLEEYAVWATNHHEARYMYIHVHFHNCIIQLVYVNCVAIHVYMHVHVL